MHSVQVDLHDTQPDLQLVMLSSGTHVSSTAAGRSVGVAKDASVVGVRVLDCDGAGSISNVVAGELGWLYKCLEL